MEGAGADGGHATGQAGDIGWCCQGASAAGAELATGIATPAFHTARAG